MEYIQSVKSRESGRRRVGCAASASSSSVGSAADAGLWPPLASSTSARSPRAAKKLLLAQGESYDGIGADWLGWSGAGGSLFQILVWRRPPPQCQGTHCVQLVLRRAAAAAPALRPRRACGCNQAREQQKLHFLRNGWDVSIGRRAPLTCTMGLDVDGGCT